ncbi:MAG TPA: hypothetical protein VH083_21755 [Myxococcales bacterium]|jgi:hypothetical protein|nr:hypothetical protein [Myxococcales bacterium]
MKLELSYHSGFSEELFGWRATLFAGRRGSFGCSWFDGAQSHERILKRYDFGLDALSFLRIAAALDALPSPLQTLKADDAPVRRIRAASEGSVVERSFIPRFAGRTPSKAEEEFNRIWFELVELVKPAFAQLQIDGDALAKNC